MILFGSAVAWWWLWLFWKWWRFHIDFCGQSQHERSWALPVPPKHVTHFKSGVSWILATRLFFQVLQVPLGCQLLPAAMWWGWDVGIQHSPNPQAYKFPLLFFLFLLCQRTSLGRHWCISRCGWGCCAWRGSCSSSLVGEELSASTTTRGQRLWAWPWRGATRSCTSFWQSKDDLVVPLLVFRSPPRLDLLCVITQRCLSAVLHP